MKSNSSLIFHPLETVITIINNNTIIKLLKIKIFFKFLTTYIKNIKLCLFNCMNIYFPDNIF